MVDTGLTSVVEVEEASGPAVVNGNQQYSKNDRIEEPYPSPHSLVCGDVNS